MFIPSDEVGRFRTRWAIVILSKAKANESGIIRGWAWCILRRYVLSRTPGIFLSNWKPCRGAVSVTGCEQSIGDQLTPVRRVCMRLICSKYLQVLDSLLRSSQAAGETQVFWTIFQNFSARGPTHQGKKPRSRKTDSKFKYEICGDRLQRWTYWRRLSIWICLPLGSSSCLSDKSTRDPAVFNSRVGVEDSS